jgi:hypothetical protein
MKEELIYEDLSKQDQESCRVNPRTPVHTTCYAVYLFKNGKLEEAFKRFMTSAKENEPVAQTYVGICYTEGKGVMRNAENAQFWYRKAALPSIRPFSGSPNDSFCPLARKILKLPPILTVG